jgi:hypothetical protein
MAVDKKLTPRDIGQAFGDKDGVIIMNLVGPVKSNAEYDTRILDERICVLSIRNDASNSRGRVQNTS